MRGTVAALLVGCVLADAGAALAQSEPAATAPRLTLHDAVVQALEHNPTIADAQAAIDQANLGQRLAASAFTPKVLPSLVGSFGETNLSNQTYGVNLSQKFTTGTQITANVGATSTRNQLGNYYFSDTTFQVSQSLLRGFGSTAATQSLLDAGVRSADTARQLKVAEQQLALSVAAAYYSVVVQTRLVGVARSARERAEKLRQLSEIRLATGHVSQLDVLRARQLTGQMDAQVLNADGALADDKDRLRVLIGRPMSDEFTVDEEIPVEAESLTPEQAATAALSDRTELAVATDAVAEADRAIATARNQLRPQLDLGVALTRRETATDLGSAFGMDRFHVLPFAAISMPVNATAEEISVQTAIVERGRRQRDYESLRDRIIQEARQAARRLERAKQGAALADAAVALAQKEVEVATARFQLGLSNNLDLVEAQNSLRSADEQAIAARGEVALARLGLRAATGQLDPRKDIK